MPWPRCCWKGSGQRSTTLPGIPTGPAGCTARASPRCSAGAAGSTKASGAPHRFRCSTSPCPAYSDRSHSCPSGIWLSPPWLGSVPSA
jgi:hypothetical protein